MPATLIAKRYIWCNTHNRFHELCHDVEGRFMGGILLPCRTVDITDILEIEMEKIANEPREPRMKRCKECGYLFPETKKECPRCFALR